METNKKTFGTNIDTQNRDKLGENGWTIDHCENNSAQSKPENRGGKRTGTGPKVPDDKGGKKVSKTVMLYPADIKKIEQLHGSVQQWANKIVAELPDEDKL